MLKWPTNLDLPDPELVASVVYQMCGNDTCGGAVANKIISLFVREVYASHYSCAWSASSASKAFGSSPGVIAAAYKKHGRRPYVRLLAQCVMQDVVLEMDSIRSGQKPVETTGNPYRDAARRALRNHAGRAV